MATCLYCTTEFTPKPCTKGMFCSKGCSNKFHGGKPTWNKGLLGYRKGEIHHNWKGGVTAANKAERQIFAQQIRGDIFKRDNYTCQICGVYGGRLHVDHIEKWSDNPELRFEPSNCRTVCMSCHYYITFKRQMPAGSKWSLRSGAAEC